MLSASQAIGPNPSMLVWTVAALILSGLLLTLAYRWTNVGRAAALTPWLGAGIAVAAMRWPSSCRDS